MDNIDIKKSIKSGWLQLNKNPLLLGFSIGNSVFVKGLGANIILSWVLVLLAINDIFIVEIFYIFLVTSVLIGLIETINDYHLKIVHIYSQETFERNLKHHLESNGWYVSDCSRCYFRAKKPYGLSELSVNIIYNNKSAMVSTPMTLPFPISTIASRRLLNEMQNMNTNTYNNANQH
jgi:hypothetical protein